MAWVLVREVSLLFALITLGGLLLDTLLRVYHQLQVENIQHYWQIEAVFSLYSTLKIDHPLPPMRLWAASPDFLVLSIALIKRHKPGIVVEIGSGVSTIVNSYALREAGRGSLIALEHEENFAAITADNLIAHQLSSLAQVIYAPLKPVWVDGREFLWYDREQLADIPAIDLLIVDGPPEKTGPLARLPALSVLFDKLNDGAYILVDDFMRTDEHTMVSQWVQAFPLQVVRTYANEKGAAILRKTSVKDRSAE
ncbi:MAG: class I SAM-dependent methyltransferase [Anaerolineae bacterium]|nr:class I SAM-dependent methyltransferase [Anaerolineae bacterium]